MVWFELRGWRWVTWDRQRRCQLWWGGGGHGVVFGLGDVVAGAWQVVVVRGGVLPSLGTAVLKIRF